MDGKDQQIVIERYNPEVEYDFSGFDCGVEHLNAFLTDRLKKESDRKLSVTHLCVIGGSKSVVGYFTLASSSFEKKHLSNAKRRKIPYQSLPCILLSKLAVCKSAQGNGMGKWLLGRAIRQAYTASRDVGISALFLHAREGVEQFYIDAGMIQSVCQPEMFIYPLQQYEDELKRLAEK